MIDPDLVVWAYRVILGRDPESQEVVQEKARSCANLSVLRASLLNSTEYRQANAPEGSTEVIFEDDEGDRFCLDLNDLAIGRNIMAGRYEPDVLAVMRGLGLEKRVCIDVGANIGYFSIKMAKMGARHVYAFEPIKYIYERLEKTVTEMAMKERRSGLTMPIHTYNLAVGGKDQAPMVAIHAPDTINHGGAYLTPAGTKPPPNHAAEPVSVVDLDSFARAREDMFQDLEFIKMDVEGAEPMVVDGGWDLITQRRPHIIAEIHRTQYEKVSQTTPEAFLDRFFRIGYQAFVIRPADPFNLVELLPNERMPDYGNVLLTP